MNYSNLRSERTCLVAVGAAVLVAALIVGCERTRDEPPAPAVAVLPNVAAVVDAATPAAGPVTADGQSSNIVAPSPPLAIVDGGGRGTVSVISGAGTTTVPMSVPLSAPSEILSAGLPPAPAASLPGASSIGPAASAAPAEAQPLSVSPGSSR